MSDLRVSNLKGRTPGSSPVLPDGIRVTGVGTFSSDVNVAGDLNVTGDLVYDEATAVNLKISGIATVGSAITMYGSSGIVSATSYYGSGANLTGIDATALKDSGGSVKVQANSSGAVLTGILTATSYYGDAANMTNAGISAGKAMGLAAFLG